MQHQGLRYNENKIRYDLLEPFAINELAKVFSKGAEKYEARNWEKGMSWSSVLASLKRHISAWENGEDKDPESQLLHMGHVAWNALCLLSYYKLYPKGDDRRHKYLVQPKVGLDIDEVLCDFTQGWADVYDDVSARPTSWYYDRNMLQRFEDMRAAGTLDDFYRNLKPKIDPNTLPFEPRCYVTSRPVRTEVTIEWLDKHGFPRVPVHTVGLGEDKSTVLKEAGVDVFIDDSFNNFVNINKSGILCYLWDAPHNARFDVGFKRIYSFDEVLK
jgi:5'(3')-deoxyribonucleotidase